MFASVSKVEIHLVSDTPYDDLKSGYGHRVDAASMPSEVGTAEG